MDTANTYHHGLTIREYRSQRGMTLAGLAERWPSGPVTPNYLQKVETGTKHLADQSVLRQVAALLEIPLWRFGLSDFDPFRLEHLPGGGERLFSETLDVVEHLVSQTWFMRRVAPAPETEKSATHLLRLFASLLGSLPPTGQGDPRFLRLYAQVLRLNAIMQIERQRYAEALLSFHDMARVARELGEPATLALAFMGIGTELERAGKQQEAIDYLEQARDTSFDASKQIRAVVNAYLARAYASNQETTRFRRAIDTAETIARQLGAHYGDGTDYVFHRLSGILAERSYGYLELGEPRKVLDLQPEITRAIDVTRNAWLDAWIPLDWARAYLLLGEAEESAREGSEFFHRVTRLQSPHALDRAYDHLKRLQDQEYGDVSAVRELREQLEQARQTRDDGADVGE